MARRMAGSACCSGTSMYFTTFGSLAINYASIVQADATYRRLISVAGHIVRRAHEHDVARIGDAGGQRFDFRIAQQQ